MAVKIGCNLDFSNLVKAINLPDGVNPGDSVNFGQLTTAIAGTLKTLQTLDASTNPATYPAGDVGDGYYITADGTVGGDDFETGDVLIKVGPGTTAADYVAIQGKLPIATETEYGKTILATQAEVDSGVSANPGAVVTPETLQSKLDDFNEVVEFDATGDPNYPAALEGQLFNVTGNGLIGGAGGVPVQIGDVILAVADSAGGNQATAGADFVVIQSNTQQATEEVRGVIELATQAEVDAGTDDERAVTPLKLATYVAANAGTINKYVEPTIGDGVATSFSINHALGTEDLGKVSVIDNNTGEEWITCITIDDANNITVDFDLVPTTNQFRVVVLG